MDKSEQEVKEPLRAQSAHASDKGVANHACLLVSCSFFFVGLILRTRTGGAHVLNLAGGPVPRVPNNQRDNQEEARLEKSFLSLGGQRVASFS